MGELSRSPGTRRGAKGLQARRPAEEGTASEEIDDNGVTGPTFGPRAVRRKSGRPSACP